MTESEDYTWTSILKEVAFYTELYFKNSTMAIPWYIMGVNILLFYVYYDTEWLPYSCIMVLLWYNYYSPKKHGITTEE